MRDEAHGDLVGDDLRRGAQAAEQRVGRARGPAGEHDTVDADRGDREHVEHGDGKSVSCSGVRCPKGSVRPARTGSPRTRGTAVVAEMIGARM